MSTLLVLDAPARTYRVALLGRQMTQLVLQSPAPIDPGATVQLRHEGLLFLGEVTASVFRNGQFELEMRVLLESHHPDPERQSLDGEESLTDSLFALNAHLMFYEKRWRTSRGPTPTHLGESG